MYTKLLTAALLAVLLSACATGGPAVTDVNYSVEVEAHPHQGYVEVLTDAQGWGKSFKKKGYVGYKRGESGTTTFKVIGEKDGVGCANGADWVITRLQLTTRGSQSSEKGRRASFGKGQPGWLSESFPGLKSDTDGNLFEAGNLNEGVPWLEVENANGQRGTQWIYYMLTLSSCDGKFQVRTDPAWKNGGRTTN